MLQNGQQPLPDASDQLQSRVDMFRFQQADTRGQVSALQQSLHWGPQHQSDPTYPYQPRAHDEDMDLTEQDLQSVGVKVQSLCLLLHHLHLLRFLVVVAVDAGVGQHLQAESRAQLPSRDLGQGMRKMKVPCEPG